MEFQTVVGTLINILMEQELSNDGGKDKEPFQNDQGRPEVFQLESPSTSEELATKLNSTGINLIFVLTYTSSPYNVLVRAPRLSFKKNI